MRHRIEYGPAFAWLRLRLNAGESIDTEAGSMIARTPSIGMTTRLNAGRSVGVLSWLWSLIVALSRKFLGGETMFINTFTAQDDGELALAPALGGDIVRRRLTPNLPPLIVQTGSYLASAPGVSAELMWSGLRGLLSREGLFFLRCTGEGDLFICAHGGITEIECRGGYVVDTGHIVAFEASLDYEIGAAGSGIKGLVASGEGLVCTFSGVGRIWIQSRNIQAFATWLNPNL